MPKIILTIFTLIFALGYVLNVIAFAGGDFKEPYKEDIIRTMGIFVPPIGCVIGFISITNQPTNQLTN